MPNGLKISLDHRVDEIFIPNQLISGYVELQINEPITKAKGLSVKLEGNAYCHFLIGKKANVEFEDYSQRCPKIYLIGDSDHEENFKFPCGTHTFNFSYRLPNDIPYSIEDYYGHVRYKLQAKLEVARGFDLKAEKKINIGSNFDVSPFRKAPFMIFEETKMFGCLSCQSGYLIMHLLVAKRVNALGQKIRISVNLVNRSSANISRTEFSLIRTDTFTSKIHQKVEQKIVATDAAEGVRRGKSCEFVMTFKVPENILTSSRFCKIFKISYELKFTAKVNGLNLSPNIFIPIVIGDFPIEEM